MFCKRPHRPHQSDVSIDITVDLDVSCKGTAMRDEGIDDLQVFIGKTEITDELSDDEKNSICEDLWQAAIEKEQHQWEAYQDDLADRKMRERWDD